MLAPVSVGGSKLLKSDYARFNRANSIDLLNWSSSAKQKRPSAGSMLVSGGMVIMPRRTFFAPEVVLIESERFRLRRSARNNRPSSPIPVSRGPISPAMLGGAHRQPDASDVIHDVDSDDEDEEIRRAIAMSLQEQHTGAPTTPAARATRRGAPAQLLFDNGDDDDDDDDDYGDDSDMDIVTPGTRRQKQHTAVTDVDDDDQAEEIQRAIQASMAAAPARSAVLLDDDSDDEVEIVTRSSATATTTYTPSPTASSGRAPTRDEFEQAIDMTDEDPDIQEAIALSLAQASGMPAPSSSTPTPANSSRRNNKQQQANGSNGAETHLRGNGSAVHGIRSRRSPQAHPYVTGLSRDRRLQALEELERYQPYQPPPPEPRETSEQRERRLLREQQEREYQEGLEQDRLRELAEREAEFQRLAQERQEQERQRAEQERLAAESMQKDAIVARAKQIVAESVPDNEDDEFPVALTLPNGKRTMHTFSKRNPFSSTYTMLQSSSQALGFATIKLTHTHLTVLPRYSSIRSTATLGARQSRCTIRSRAAAKYAALIR